MLGINDINNLDDVIYYAKSVKATDIHIIADSKPAVRVNKELVDIPFSNELTPEMAKKLAEECLNEKNKKILEEDGEVDFSFPRCGARYRANVFKQKGNYSMALRVISESIPEFDSLKLPQAIKAFSEKHKGLVLVTGATGSGKSTTLASLIDIINTERKAHIITVEDPIEYVHKHKSSKINQREIGSDTKSFSSALRAALREDPDVILVGEMRDPETISTALTAAETGHLVFSTLHTVGAAKTIDRIIDAFPSEKQAQIRTQLATVLNGIVSQELIPKMDKDGIVAACEVMVVNSAIRNLIREGKPHQINSIIQMNKEIGMQSLDSALVDLASRGIISTDEVNKRAQDGQVISKMLGKGW